MSAIQYRSASDLRRLKDQIGYEHHTPHCGSCKHFEANNPARIKKGVCNKYLFPAKALGLCDSWIGHDGAVLGEEKK